MTTSVIKNAFDERLDVTFHPGSKKDTLVLLGHGLTGNKDRPLLVALANGLSERGWPCMRISFSGNGDSEGVFGDSNVSKQVGDLKAILDTVPDYVKVAYVGHSMGAAVGVMTAAEDLRIQVLVSLAGMARTADFVEREFGALTPGEDCMWEEDGFPLSGAFMDDMRATGDILPIAATVPQPWLLVHGTADDLVPVEDSRDAHAAAICRKRLLEVEGAGHAFEVGDYPKITEAVHDWLATHFGGA